MPDTPAHSEHLASAQHAAEPLRVLVVEDSEDDAQLIVRELRAGGFAPTFLRVDGEAAMRAALSGGPWDLVLSDYVMPGFGGMQALKLFKSGGIDVPFVIVTGKVGEETAVEAMKAGATDFVMKDHLSRLVPVVKRELADCVARRALRQARDAAGRLERRLRALTEHSSDLVVVCDASGVMSYASPSLTRLAGYAPEEVTGRRYLDFVHPDDARDCARDLAGIVAAPDRIVASEFRYRRKDGRWIWMHSIARNALADSAVGGIVINARDVTERHAAEDAVRKFSADLLQAQRVARLGSWTLDAATGEVSWSEELFRIFERDPAKGAPSWSEQAALYTKESHERLKAAIDAALATGAPFELDLEIGGGAQTRWAAARGEAERDGSGRVTRLHGTAMDITERKRAEAELAFKSVILETQQEASIDGILVVDENARVIGYNRRFLELWKLDAPEIGGDDERVLAIVLTKARDPEAFLARIRHLYSHREMESRDEVELIDGRCFDRYSAPMWLEGGRYLGRVWYFRDVTERKRADETLRRSEAQLAQAQRIARLGSWEMGHADAAFSWSAETYRIFEEDPATYRPSYEAFLAKVHPDERASLDAAFKASVRDHTHYEAAHRIVLADGRLKHVHERCETTYDDQGRPVRSMGTVQDITDRVLAERGLKLFRTLVDSAADEVHVVDADTLRLLDVSESSCAKLGYTRDELLALRVPDIVTTDPETFSSVSEKLRTQGSATFETLHRRKDGSTYPVEITGRQIALDRNYLLAIIRDITERKRSEAALARSNRALKALSAGNEVLVRASDEHTLLSDMTRVMVEAGGYRAAWVGYPENDARKTIRPVASFGFDDEDYLRAAQIGWGEDPQGQGPTGMALRTGRTQVNPDFASSNMAPWREEALRHGFAGSISLPLTIDAKTMGALTIYTDDREAFDDREIRLLEEMASDLSYGIGSLRSRADRDSAMQQLRRGLEGTVEAMAATLEMRDPYTAGHQRRVADLAAAIAREMGLPEATVQGIRFGALIHDLGKIKVPAEILAKPTRLSPTEFSLIKEHPRSGYEILKDIEFPWPVATMVLQHHERLDGSGYPDGLRGDAITVESRVIAVADVVEAMSSHRPYRAGLGIEAALAQVESERGRTLDARVVDACLALFRAKSFQFPANQR